MSYLQKLITKAVDQEAENNILGKYSISPEHGVNLYRYQIKKNNEYLATINIYGLEIDIEVGNQFKGNDLIEIVSTLQDLYPNHLVKTFQHARVL